MTNSYRALPSLAETIQAADEAMRGSLRIVVESRNQMVRVKGAWPDAPEEFGWYASTVRECPVGESGVLLPVRGGKAVFLPCGPNLWATNYSGRYMWSAGRWQWVHDRLGYSAKGNNTTVANRTYGVPFVAPASVIVSHLSVYVGPTAGGNVILGLYETAANGLATGSPIAETASLASTTAGFKTGAVSEVAIKAGHPYVLAVVTSEAIQVGSFVPTHGFYLSSSETHEIYVCTHRDGGSFDLATPDASYSQINPTLGIRRKP